MKEFVRFANALLILVLMGVICGAMYEVYHGQGLPCPLCWMQRAGMIGVATGAFLNLKFGIQMKHYAISLASAIVGGSVSLRQVALHVCPNFSTFGNPVLGMNLYSWAFVVFSCSVIAIIILLFLYEKDQSKEPKKMNGFEFFAAFVLIAVTVADIYFLYNQCGFGPCGDVPWPQTALRAHL